jgi:hypothetical protein
MSRVLVALTIFSLLAGCYMGDAGVHVAYERDFREHVVLACIEAALRAVAPDVRRATYQADGNGPRGFERGTIVTQFNYDDPSSRGGYTLDVAAQPDGKTHYWHGWGKIGTKIPPEEQYRVVPLLVRANLSVERRCGLPFTGAAPTIGDG